MESIADDYARVCPVCGREIAPQADDWEIPAGSVVRGSHGHAYLFGEAKSSGGFGITYIAKEMNTGTVVAIKEYFPFRCALQRKHDLSVQPSERMQDAYRHGMQSFHSEASMLRALQDVKSIVRVLDYFEANNTAYMVMEYLNGTTLSSLMETQTHFEPSLLLRKFLPLMRDLDRIHEAGVLHRDIAPDNIMLMPDGRLKLFDFGCARSMEDGRSMTVLLKRGIAPVEQYMTRGQGPYTDVYALCATIYYCLTGVLPPEAPSRLSSVSDREADPLLPLSAYKIQVSPELDQTLLWGLAIQPADRAQSMGELARRIEAELGEEAPNAAEPADATADEGAAPRSRPSLRKILLAIALAAGAAALWALIRWLL